ncbi:hypothetical protein [Shewanella atlantica]|uniref:hypothetical protein n=1 Tax=Shewanella atlantica TaxID=271099 RepID=UPI003736C68E
MPKSILLIALSFSFFLIVNSAARAAVSPLPLLVEQCLQLKVTLPPATVQDVTKQSHALEASLQGLFNVKDRLNFYKSRPVPSRYREGVLHCQLHLADLMESVLNSTNLALVLQAIEAEGDAELKQLSLRWSKLADMNTDLVYKSRLHTAQAAIKQGLRSQALTLKFGDTDCQLSPSAASDNGRQGSNSIFDNNIAAYLIAQTNPLCQQLVWNAYQGRARARNREALDSIAKLRQHRAVQAGYDDHSSFSLSKQFLSTPELVKAFLDSVTESVDTPPWLFGSSLSQSARFGVTPVGSASLLASIYQESETLGFRVEIVNQNTHRVWHRERLLGDLFLTADTDTRAQVLRFPVVGRQFGQVSLMLKPEMSSYTDMEALVFNVAFAFNALSGSSHYYLNNTLGETSDTSQLGRYWLEHYLADKVLPSLPEESRELKLKSYRNQLKIFRAKVALDFYSAKASSLYPSLRNEFIRAFGNSWDETENYAYNFFAIADEGPDYYRLIWQRSLAGYIYQSTKNCKDQYRVFDTITVNESSTDLTARLLSVLGSPVDAKSLIKRIQDANHTQVKRPVTCSL